MALLPRSFAATTLRLSLRPCAPSRVHVQAFSASAWLKDVPTPTHFKAPPATPSSDPVNASASSTESHDYMMPHPIWSKEQVQNVKVTHLEPPRLVDKAAYYTVQAVRSGFDYVTGYSHKPGVMTERQWMMRLAFLETVAGVPGFMGAMVRHLSSLRRMGRDHGWIHTLLEDAENERMHLLFVMEILKPGMFMRFMVLAAQGVFSNFFFLAYLLSPRYCHRFVGYLEEEAVHTYETMINDIEVGSLKHWGTTPAPDIAKKYWRLAPEATLRDVIYAIRADEAHHRTINHTLADLKSTDANPFPPGRELKSH